MFKCFKGLAPSYLCDRFVTRSVVHDRNTRKKDSLNIPGYKSASEQRNFCIGLLPLAFLTTCSYCS